jgi:hypothetical protein
MPGSSPKGKIETLKLKKELVGIKHVLDIGPGWGTYHRLLKEEGEQWDAVEVFPDYIERFQLRKRYDKVYNIDILKFTPEKEYDLVILGDILEHVKKEDGVELLKKIFSYTRYCLISLPLDEETGVDLENAHDYWNNIHERHLAVWSNTDFVDTLRSIGAEILFLKKYEELGVYLATTKENSFVVEHIALHQKPKHTYIASDFGRNFLETPKYLLLKVVPSPLVKKLKSILGYRKS